MGIVEIRDLRKSYKNKVVLNGLNLDIQAGEFWGLVGKNGAGKSTLLNILCGVVNKSSGTFRICNAEETALNTVKRKIGIMPDVSELFGDMTGSEFLFYMMSLKGKHLNKRLLMAAVKPHTFEAVTAVFECAGQTFTAKARTVLSDGWKGLERRYRATLKTKPDPEDDGENGLLSGTLSFSEGQTFDNPTAKVTEHDTTPPKPHNEASLLSAMERAGNEETEPDAERRGLGTPATRAAVIEKLVKGGFVERKGKQLIPTKDGINLVCVLPEALTSPKLTAEWENNLTQ